MRVKQRQILLYYGTWREEIALENFLSVSKFDSYVKSAIKKYTEMNTDEEMHNYIINSCIYF